MLRHFESSSDVETPAEEVVNGITHGVGIVLALAALVVMACNAGSLRGLLSVIVYGSTLLLMYIASTGYHLARWPRAKRMMLILDHASIYLLIAGTYTPLLLLRLRGPWGWSLFGVLWGLALIGIAVKLFYVDRLRTLSTVTYVLMAWLGVIAVGPLMQAVPHMALLWMLIGGLAYTGGVVFFMWEKLPFNHAIWHLAILAGSACHFIAISRYVMG